VKATRLLGQLNKMAERRLQQIEDTVDGLGIPITFEKDRLASFASIELDNVWASFSKNYYLSWFLHPITRQGVRVEHTIAHPINFPDAIRLASKVFHGKTHQGRTGRIDPPWHERRCLMLLAKQCGASHEPQVIKAMSVKGTVFEYLRTIRNFYAHRCEETASKLPRVARAFGLVPTRRASEIILAVPPGRRVIVMLDWIAEIRAAMQLLCD
jgi:hypothetical protein